MSVFVSDMRAAPPGNPSVRSLGGGDLLLSLHGCSPSSYLLLNGLGLHRTIRMNWEVASAVRRDPVPVLFRAVTVFCQGV